MIAFDELKKHILFHSLGLDENGHGNMYRNYHCVSVEFETKELFSIREMERDGLMREGNRINDGRDQYFIVTDKGKNLARGLITPLPKLSRSQKRYRAFLDADSGATFKEYITQK